MYVATLTRSRKNVYNKMKKKLSKKITHRNFSTIICNDDECMQLKLYIVDKFLRVFGEIDNLNITQHRDYVYCRKVKKSKRGYVTVCMKQFSNANRNQKKKTIIFYQH